MDKNKSRTDLLAAGRKKLQQFRQKKDGKGSGSGKSTKTSDKSEKHEADADVVSSATKPIAVPQTTEGETESRVDANLENINSSGSHSGEISTASDINAAAPSAVPITHERNAVETLIYQNAESASQEVGFSKCDVNFSATNVGESTGGTDAEVARISSLDSSHVMDSRGLAKDASMSISVDVSAQPTSVDDTDQTKGRDEESLPPSQNINTSLVQEREDQLVQQSEMQVEFDCQHDQLLDETSLLRASLQEVREKNQCLAEELSECRCELQAVVSGKEEFQDKLQTAKAEVEEFSARAIESHSSLERSRQDLLSLSAELADCKSLVAALQVENEKLNGSIALWDEDRKKLVEQNDLYLHEKEKLSAELVDGKSSVEALQDQISSLSGSLGSVTEERKKLTEEKEHLSSENDKLSIEVADSKNTVLALQVDNGNLNRSLSLVTEERKKLEEETKHIFSENEKLAIELAASKNLILDLQVENEKLNGSLALVTGERKKLEEEKDYSAHEIEKLSSEILVLQEQLSAEHEEHKRLEVDLKETTTCLEKLSEENNFLTSSLDILKAKIIEVDNSGIKIASQAGEGGDQVELSEVRSRSHEIETENEKNHQDSEGSFIMVEKPSSDGSGGGSPVLNLGREVFDDSFGFVALKGRVEEAEKMLNKLVQEIEGICSRSELLNRSADKVSTPPVLKLIQAFESKVHLDEHDGEERGLTDNQSLADSIASVREQTGNLRALFEQLLLDAANASELLKEERDGRKTANATFVELKDQYEDLEEHSKKLEATNIELGVLYEALEQHRASIETRNSELVVLCESLRLQVTNLEAENMEVGRKLHKYESRINQLQSRLHDLHLSTNDTVSQISDQLENFHKEAADRVLILEQHWDSTLAPVVEAIGKLGESIGSFTTTTPVSHYCLDSSHFVASVYDAITVIKDLTEKLKSSQTDRDAICILHKEVNEKCDDLHVKNELASEMLHKLYGNLRKLLRVLHGSIDESEMNLENEKLPDPLDYSIYETIIEQLENFLSEGLQLQSVHKKLDSELMVRTEEFEELRQRCLDSSAIRKLIEDIEGLLNQEEQKSASVREKLNVAVRKGKQLVQQRDSLKQNIDEINSEVERLRSEIKIGEGKLAEYEQKFRDLSAYPGRVEALQSESLFLRNCLKETENNLQEKGNTLSLIINILGNIDVADDANSGDPVLKLEQIGKMCCDLRANMASSEQEARKSKRAAELLLAELNEVQERNDGLQEELAKSASELAILSKERDLAEAAKLEALSHLEMVSTAHSEERKHQFSEFSGLKSGVDQLRKGFHDVSSLLAGVFHQDLVFLQNLESGIDSCLKSSSAADVVDVPLFTTSDGFITSKSDKENFISTNSWSDSNMHGQFDDNFIIEIFTHARHYLQELEMEIGLLKEKLDKHSISLHEKASSISKSMAIVRGELTSKNESFESLKRDLLHMEMVEKEKDNELLLLRRNIALLFEACTKSVMEMGRKKAELVGNGWSAGEQGMRLKLAELSEDGLSFSGEDQFRSEERVRSMTDMLLSTVSDFGSLTTEIVEGGQKELKITISKLQKELQEKDVQRERICMELVSQIKHAEAAATSYSMELQSSKSLVHDLEKRVEVMNGEHNLLEQRVNELEDGCATSTELQERVRSLTDVIAAKDQEIEDLMQALDDEEVQMQGHTSRIKELEKVVEQKNLDLENLETSRGKVMKKLSITVSKFDELHHLSASLLAEVEKLQSQLQERDDEISFLRQEVTRCTNDVLAASQTSNKRNSEEIHELLTWLDMNIARVGMHNGDQNNDQVSDHKEILKKKIDFVIQELGDLRDVAQSKDTLLQVERSKVEELTRKGETLEKSLHEKESRLNLLDGVGDSGRGTSSTSEIVEVEPAKNNWAVAGTSVAPQVRSLRKGNNDQVAIAIDMDSGSSGRLEDEEDDKVHGFKSLTTSRIVPRFTRPVSDMVDGLWMSCDRALMRKPVLRLGIILYWAVLHALLATFAI
ncbi:hypothetical protein C1H46_027638 [Malus baccata]|uniref:Uncharacterized protein n=1 Tax=Malus baccata TaxID=106549 RepID=A0A540LJW3_MALBA|nr:hypothetical protein C1H46_027638 [Malus baccata]